MADEPKAGFHADFTCGCGKRFGVWAKSVETMKVPPCPRCGQEFSEEDNEAFRVIITGVMNQAEEKDGEHDGQNRDD